MPKALRSIPGQLWFFLFSVVLFTVSVLRLPGVGAETDPTDVDRYTPDDLTLRRAVILYHKDMNELFNDNIEILLSEDAIITAPEDPADCDIDEFNVSTYCVALRAVDLYDAFTQALDQHAALWVDNEESEEEGNFFQIDQAVQQRDDRLSLIADQISVAETTLDVTLATYNELYLFYNLHVEYVEVIDELEDYRDELSKLRQQVEKFPDKFHDRMTTECT